MKGLESEAADAWAGPAAQIAVGKMKKEV